MDRTIGSMWGRLLATDDIGGDDDFFARGGDAVIASDLLSLVRDAFDVEIAMGEFLTAPTVTGLAAMVERRLDAAPRPSDPDRAPIGFSQEGMLWYEHFAPGSFNMAPFVRRYRGPLDVDALRRALGTIIGRHAALRSTFEIVAGRPVQRIQPADDLPLPVADLTALDAGGRHAEVSRRIDEAASLPFDLSRGPLFQPSLLQLGEHDHVLVIRVHHLVFDDWAVDVFRRELSALYRAHVSGDPPGLPPLPIDFPEFCRRQRRRLAGPEGRDQLAFWRRELAGAPWTTQLPIEDPDRPRGSRHRAVGPLYYPLPEPQVDGLRSVARGRHTTLFMALLAVFAVVAGADTGADDLVLASVVANRNRPELEHLIGCFTKKIVLRLNLTGDPSFGELAVRVRDALLGSLAHQDLPFETVVQQVLGPAAAAHGLVPELSTMFQAETPRRQKLLLPGLTVGGYDVDRRADQPHFASGRPDERAIWGGGLYPATFLILSVLEGPDGVSLVARGAFHPPAVDALVGRFVATLGRVVADPDGRLSELATAPKATGPGLVTLGGFRVDPARVAAAIVRHPGVRKAAVRVQQGEAGDRLVVHVVADGDAAVTLGTLRHLVWQEVPGYAWPADLVVVPRIPDARSFRGSPPPPPLTGDGGLGQRWSKVLGAGPVAPDANYWQRFAFLDAIRTANLVGSEQVLRNRTLRTLAADVAVNGGR